MGELYTFIDVQKFEYQTFERRENQFDYLEAQKLQKDYYELLLI